MQWMNKVMIIDDNQEILDALQMIFELENYEVYPFNNGHNIVDKITDTMPNVILMDIVLGNYDGRDICNEIKTDAKLKFIPVILISATHGAESFILKECKPDGYMPKPFNVKELTALVASKLIN